MNVLLIGSGGRESALAYKILQSPILTSLKVFPGNGGFDESLILPIDSMNLKDKNSVQSYVSKMKFDLVVVGPEDPLVDGISDWLDEIGIPCFGPSKYCAQLEGSKDFAKNLMSEFNIPTAKFETFDNYESAEKYTLNHSIPIVVKADGLAAGKGVSVCVDNQSAINFLKEIFVDKKFSDKPKVVIEEFLQGQEASIFAISDGTNFLILPALQDHKRAYENDEGPNTGGMGAYCPAPIVNSKVLDQVKEEVFFRMLNGLNQKGKPYKGLLYAGLMIHDDYAKVVEFNCRFGDPETQALMLLINEDILQIFYDASIGKLNQEKISIYDENSCVVVIASNGYPNEYIKNIPIKLNEDKNIKVFHAGTKRIKNEIFSTGGRVLGVSSKGKNLQEALSYVYKFLENNKIENTFFRKDIGKKAL